MSDEEGELEEPHPNLPVPTPQAGVALDGTTTLAIPSAVVPSGKGSGEVVAPPAAGDPKLGFRARYLSAD